MFIAMSINKSRIETVLSLSDEIRELRAKVAMAQEELAKKERVLQSLLGGASAPATPAASSTTAPAPKKRGRPKKNVEVATPSAESIKAEPKKRGRKPGKAKKEAKKEANKEAKKGGRRKQGTSGRIVELLHAQGNKGLTTVEMAKQLGAANRLQSIRSLASRLVRDGVLVKAPEGRYRAK